MMMVPLHVGSVELELDGTFHPQITTVKPVQTSLTAKEVRVIPKVTFLEQLLPITHLGVIVVGGIVVSVGTVDKLM